MSGWDYNILQVACFQEVIPNSYKAPYLWFHLLALLKKIIWLGQGKCAVSDIELIEIN